MSVSFQVYTVCGHILLMWLIKSYVSNEMMCNEVNFCKLIFEKDADRLLRIWKMTVKHKISLFFFFPQNEIIKSNYFYSLRFIFFFWPFFLAMFIPLSESVQLIKHCRTFVFFQQLLPFAILWEEALHLHQELVARSQKTLLQLKHHGQDCG